MTNQSYEILQYLKEHNGASAIEVAEALEMEKRRVDSYFSAAIIREGLGERDTTTTPSRLLLNEKGLLYTQ
jgi:predicted ArsR family transcriptional regulator